MRVVKEDGTVHTITGLAVRHQSLGRLAGQCLVVFQGEEVERGTEELGEAQGDCSKFFWMPNFCQWNTFGRWMSLLADIKEPQYLLAIKYP